MSGLVLLCSLLGPMLGRASSARGPRLPLAPLLPLSMLAAEAEAAARAGPRVLGPRMDYDEWTPLGHGDPLKNDPTFDYVPPVLDRVHYWMEAKEGESRLDAVPVPPTMLVPPPLPAPSGVAAPDEELSPAPAASATYSSLNPFHHFEDRPVVPNVLFEERPMFEASLSPVAPPARPPPGHPPPSAPSAPELAEPREPPQHSQERPAAPAAPAAPARFGSKLPHGPNAIQRDPHKPTQGKLALPGPIRLGPKPRPPQPPSTPPSTTTTPPSTTKTPPPTTTASPASSTSPVADDTISSLVRGLLHKEASTTMTTLTTDPLFAHYKQPVTPVNVLGPAYLIIQGHSKVKTYGPVLRAYDGPKAQTPRRGQQILRRVEHTDLM